MNAQELGQLYPHPADLAKLLLEPRLSWVAPDAVIQRAMRQVREAME